MSENKTGKYLKYAIGEIVLVVIGILIALQINNWNEKRILQINNIKYLEKMILDLKSNNRRFHLLVYSDNNFDGILYPCYENSVKTIDSLLKLTYSGLNKSNLNYVLNANFDEGQAVLNINDNTFLELTNTGKLYTLGDQDLIRAINRYYKLCEARSVYNDRNNNSIQDNLEKFEDGFGKIFIDARLDSINFNIDNYPFYFDKHSEEYKNFQTGLTNIMVRQRLNMSEIKRLMRRTDSLIKTINAHLPNDQNLP